MFVSNIDLLYTWASKGFDTFADFNQEDTIAEYSMKE